MTTDKFLVTYTPVGGTEVNISNLINISMEEGIRSTADSFSFSILDRPKDSTGTNINFDDLDRIKIYFWSDNNTPALVMDGTIKEFNYYHSVDKKTWSIIGQNSLELLLNAPLPAPYSATSTNNTAALIVKDLVKKAIGLNKPSLFGLPITAELKSIDATNGKIDDTSYTIPTLPTPYYRKDTPVYQMIEELSTWKWTGQDPNIVGGYIYFIDSANRFNWIPRPTTVTSTINVGDYIECIVSKSVFDVINFAIIDCGLDFNGRPIKTYYFGRTGIVKGIRGKYFAFPEIASNMIDPLSRTATNQIGTKDIDGNTNNATFRSKVIAAGKSKGAQIVATFGQARFSAKIKMKGNTTYTKGNLYRISVPNIFRDSANNLVNSLQLRLYDIQHSFTAKGWFTTLIFKQDELSLSGVTGV